MITGHTNAEDDALQGLTVEAQLIYLRGMRRHVDFASGLVRVSFGMAKRVVEFIPDLSSNQRERRVSDISNHFIRARFDELRRAGLCERKAATIKGETPVFFLPLLATGLIRQKSEPTYEPTYEPTAINDDGPHGCGVSDFGADQGADRGTDLYQYKYKLINKRARGVPDDVPLNFGQVMDVLQAWIKEQSFTKPYNRTLISKLVGMAVTKDELIRVAQYTEETLNGDGFNLAYFNKAFVSRRTNTGTGGGSGTGRKVGGKLSVAEQAAELDEEYG